METIMRASAGGTVLAQPASSTRLSSTLRSNSVKNRDNAVNLGSNCFASTDNANALRNKASTTSDNAATFHCCTSGFSGRDDRSGSHSAPTLTPAASSSCTRNSTVSSKQYSNRNISIRSHRSIGGSSIRSDKISGNRISSSSLGLVLSHSPNLSEERRGGHRWNSHKCWAAHSELGSGGGDADWEESNHSSSSHHSSSFNSDNSASSASSTSSSWTGQVKTKKDLLLEYVNTVQPEFIDRFFQKADEQVVDAMRQTVSNMLGTLPPQFFEVTVSTVGENLAQLMFSVMMTGYMFRNAQYRMELSTTLGAVTGAPGASSSSALLPGTSGAPIQTLSSPRYAEGVQKTHVAGDVLRWNQEQEQVESMAAVEYIEMLEGEVRKLQRELEGERSLRLAGAEHHNALLDYLKRLEPRNLEALTSSAAGDALEAMNVFIRRLLGVPDLTQITDLKSRTTVAEMARLLYWLMVVGYSLRSLEVRFDMEQALLSAPSAPRSLPRTDNEH